MKETAAIVLALATLQIGIGPAGACTCADSPAEAMFAYYAVAFRGSPVSYEFERDDWGTDSYVFQFLVTAHWKGDVGDRVELRSLVSEAACGVFMPSGGDFIVYANETSGTLSTHLCAVFDAQSPTGQAHLDWLGEPLPPINAESWGGIKLLYR